MEISIIEQQKPQGALPVPCFAVQGFGLRSIWVRLPAGVSSLQLHTSGALYPKQHFALSRLQEQVRADLGAVGLNSKNNCRKGKRYET